MRPLILDFKIARSECDYPVIYIYDAKQGLNVVHSNEGTKPFIDINITDVEFLTKTKVNRENDDDQVLLELSTKTEVKKERDDHTNSTLEFSTKTFTSKERDDQRTDLVEMLTQTRVQREQDDEHSAYN